VISAMDLLERGMRIEIMSAVERVLSKREKNLARDDWPLLFVANVRIQVVEREREPIRWKAQKLLRVRHRIRALGPLSQPYHAFARRSGEATARRPAGS
jgi:hypothetical protein